MSWFFIALITPFAHGIANFVDKIILSKYFNNFSLFVYLIYGGITSILVLPIFIYFGGFGIFQLSSFDILLLIIAGLCSAGAIYFYLFALNKEDASLVVPFFQLVPVASFFLSRLILGETLTSLQIAGSLVIIFGALILSFEIEEGKTIRFRHHVVLAMVCMAILFGLEGVLFKFVAVGENFWLSNFWESIGYAILCATIFLFMKKERHAFYQSLKIHKHRISLAVLLGEFFTIGGNITLNFAFLLAPIALVRVVEGYQPIFVLVIGIIITKMWPHILQEKLHWKHMLPKIAAILVILLGSYFVLG